MSARDARLRPSQRGFVSDRRSRSGISLLCVGGLGGRKRAADALHNSFILRRQKDNDTLSLATQIKKRCSQRLFSLAVIPLFLLLSSDSCHSLHTMDPEYYGGPEYLSPVPADGERTEDLEYEVGQTGPLMPLPVLLALAQPDARRCVSYRSIR